MGPPTESCGLGAADEDTRGGFERGGWAMPLADAEVEAALNEVNGRADAFLFGRCPYDVFAGIVGNDPRDASSTLADTQWGGTAVLSGDLAAAVRELKAKPEGELLVPGGGTLIRGG